MSPPNANASPDSYAPRIHGLPQEFITLVYTERRWAGANDSWDWFRGVLVLATLARPA
jgi:hypothetical protein